ncbi:MAG TPA: chorismate synthase [Vitreimonas sp.]|jgi:chorismate synthase|nr:chorismate synthase [Vitreimonas sp.]
MSHNTFGHLFRVTTWGESHGPGIGCVVDGCPPGIPLTESDVQHWLDRRRPGTSRFVTQRREPDQVKIMSGVFGDDRSERQVTTGTPISLVIENVDQRGKDYDDIRDLYRPGHADYVYDAKYGLRDYRGGGRSSARETAARVAAGAVARRVLGDDIQIRAALVQIGKIGIDRARWDWNEVENNPFWSPDAQAAKQWEALLDEARKNGNSVGAIIEVEATGVPAGWGAPIYGKLDAEIAGALMSINAVKGVEIGAGFGAASLTGVENADEMRAGNDGAPVFLSNHAGGILGGISTGQTIVARLAIKPTSSITTPRRTIDRNGQEADIVTKGRHDPCVGIRGAPVAEAMLACVLADAKLRHRAQTGR